MDAVWIVVCFAGLVNIVAHRASNNDDEEEVRWRLSADVLRSCCGNDGRDWYWVCMCWFRRANVPGRWCFSLEEKEILAIQVSFCAIIWPSRTVHFSSSTMDLNDMLSLSFMPAATTSVTGLGPSYLLNKVVMCWSLAPGKTWTWRPGGMMSAVLKRESVITNTGSFAGSMAQVTFLFNVRG